MKRLLVTGASGFLGRNFLQIVANRGWDRVHAVSRSPFPRDGAVPCEWHECDLMDVTAVRRLVHQVKATHAMHFAWCTTPGAYWTSPENLDWVGRSIDLVQEFARAGGERFVVAGTCAEYEWKEGVCSEDLTRLLPATLYGAAKHSLQTLLAACGASLGISTAWGRVFFPYGRHEHRDRLVPYVIRSLLAGQPALCTEGTQVRDFIYAGDAAEAFAVLLESNLTGAVNIASGVEVTIAAVVREIGEQTGRGDLVRLGARPPSQPNPSRLTADVTRMRTQLGWRASTSLTQGVSESIKYWSSMRTTKSAG